MWQAACEEVVMVLLIREREDRILKFRILLNSAGKLCVQVRIISGDS